MRFKIIFLVSLILLSTIAAADPIITPGEELAMALRNLYSSIYIFILWLALTLAIELPVGYAFFHGNKKIKSILLFIFLANIISFPIVQIMSTLRANTTVLDEYPIFLHYLIFEITTNVYTIIPVLIAEAFAVIFEAAFIFYLARKFVSFRRVLVYSLAANVLSYFIVVYIVQILSNYLMFH